MSGELQSISQDGLTVSNGIPAAPEMIQLGEHWGHRDQVTGQVHKTVQQQLGHGVMDRVKEGVSGSPSVPDWGYS